MSTDETTPTLSHALAEQSVAESDTQVGDEGGRAERGSPENWNLGWDPEAARSQPFSGSLSNEDAWTLMRRFNKQVFCVRSIDERPWTTLDMNVATTDEISPERLRAQIERLYITVFVVLYSLQKQVIRLRSWREKPRTLQFLGVYALAWLVDLLAPTLVAFLILLITYPPAREACFPPAPPALIDPKTGGIQKPLSGELASDSITGAPEKHPGEAVEQEAHNFMKSIAKLTMNVSSGKQPQGDTRGSDWEMATDPSQMIEGIADERDKTKGIKTGGEEDKTKKPIAQAVEKLEVFPIMQILPEFIDNWERVENALSPTPPFPTHQPRMKLAACLLPLLVALCFASWYIIMKSLGFVTGLYLFGRPVIEWCQASLDRMYPRWRELVQLRNGLLRGVPTNSQLLVTILRIGEGNNDPLPPPPDKYQPPNDSQKPRPDDLDHLGASQDEIQSAIDPVSDEDSDASGNEDSKKAKTVRRVADAVKRVTKGTVRTIHKLNEVKAAAGGDNAKARLGALVVREQDKVAGPVQFPARYQGEKGYAYVTTTATSPAVSWRRETEGLDSAWTVSLAELSEVRKVGGVGWKSTVVVGAVLGWEVADGMVLTTKDGKEFHLTAVMLRDEMFNRLISIGGHMWEVM